MNEAERTGRKVEQQEKKSSENGGVSAPRGQLSKATGSESKKSRERRQNGVESVLGRFTSSDERLRSSGTDKGTGRRAEDVNVFNGGDENGRSQK